MLQLEAMIEPDPTDDALLQVAVIEEKVRKPPGHEFARTHN